MKIKVQIQTRGHHPANSGWFDTDKGNLYWDLYKEQWSCREERISAEYPKWWLEDLNNVPQANELLPPVSSCEPDLIRIYRVECLTEDGDIEVNGHFKDREIAELMKAEHDMNKRNIKYGIKQNIVEIILEG